MAHDKDEAGPARKGRLSAFSLLTSWLFNKKNTAPAHVETEFLNTRDGYELAKFAKQAFGGDAEAKKAQEAAVEAEQAAIDAMLQGTDVVPILHQVQAAPAAPVAVAPPPPIAPPTRAAMPVPQPAPPPPAAPPQLQAAAGLNVKEQVELAVKYLEKMREQGLSVETLAEALIIIESREVRKRAEGGT
ncbi:MAG: hypothetical protein IPI03_11465 [Rubrivivax sp.]|nr:hypothetical protein [Rubrivivax sp.]MBK7262435.1 hypothetical protein [Rubrivivax sp.]